MKLSADVDKQSIVQRLKSLGEFIDTNLSEIAYRQEFVSQMCDDIMDIYNSLRQMDDKYFTESRFSIKVNEIDASEGKPMFRVFENINDFIPDENGLFPDRLLPYHWKRISSGEYQYGKVFGQIEEFCIRMRIGERGKSYEESESPNIILLMDEPETFMHPELCHQFIYNIGRFLKDHNPAASLQIILSTHSPFMLSDFLSCQVIRMDYDKNGMCQIMQVSGKSYFAANIHTIMADGFFLNYRRTARLFLQESSIGL